MYSQHTHTQTHNHFTALLEFVWDYPVSRYQKGKNKEGKTNLDLLEQETVSSSGICWDMQVCTSSQITTLTSHHSVFTRRMPFLPPNRVKALKEKCIASIYTIMTTSI